MDGSAVTVDSDIVTRPKGYFIGLYDMHCGSTFLWSGDKVNDVKDVRVWNAATACGEAPTSYPVRTSGAVTVGGKGGLLGALSVRKDDPWRGRITLPAFFYLYSPEPPLHDWRNVDFIGYRENGRIKTIYKITAAIHVR